MYQLPRLGKRELICLLLFTCNYVIMCVVTAAGVVLCGSPAKAALTSSMVQFIFYFWSFEISGNVLRNQKILYVEIHIF